MLASAAGRPAIRRCLAQRQCRPGTGPSGRGRRPARGPPASRAASRAMRGSARRAACSRTRGSGSLRPSCELAPARAPQDIERPEGVEPARAPSAVATTSPRAAGPPSASRRSIRSRWAVSRHQASGSARRSTSSAVVAWLERGPAVPRAAVGDEVVEPAAVLAAGQVEVLLDRLGDRERDARSSRGTCRGSAACRRACWRS